MPRVAEAEGVIVAQPDPVLVDQRRPGGDALPVDERLAVVVGLQEHRAAVHHDRAVALHDAQARQLDLRWVVPVRAADQRLPFVEGIDGAGTSQRAHPKLAPYLHAPQSQWVWLL